ncbi:M23 family metallopeptidase [Marimonas lutisalis]|uniref:M23 family metallopeptidase n=1 Tax=Marimonas lutisalis TaxID=2545756 RepID=UPI001F46041C|nr:M23 family metallopeptidase [Marimonas lutisalis]
MVRADAPRLALPIDCDLGQTCYIQNFVDADPGPGYADFTCNKLSYDGHKGTDFALPSRADMARGVRVHAAAPGRVVGLRDGMADGAFLADPGSVDGRECGNGVAIDHGDGWRTQYCHMRFGSIAVSQGQQVDTGDVLGLVGLSGKTEFPHLHLSVRHNGAVVDPFKPDGAARCGTVPENTLWQSPPDYVPGGVLAVGFADHVPDYDAIKAGTAAAAGLPGDAPALVVWGLGFGGRAGDAVQIDITGPDGFHHRHLHDLSKPTALYFRASGKKRSTSAWPPGSYHGTVTLQRDNQTLSQASTTIEIGN